jgi:hypothetical protein
MSSYCLFAWWGIIACCKKKKSKNICVCFLIPLFSPSPVSVFSLYFPAIKNSCGVHGVPPSKCVCFWCPNWEAPLPLPSTPLFLPLWFFGILFPNNECFKTGSGLKIECGWAKNSTWLAGLARRVEKNRRGIAVCVCVSVRACVCVSACVCMEKQSE